MTWWKFSCSRVFGMAACAEAERNKGMVREALDSYLMGGEL